jgi:CheY-like chemotaxis protein
LEGGGQQHLLAEALTTLGTALARLSQRRYAGLTFQSAMLIAEQAGDREGAGQATLTALEELSETFTVGELAAMYERAADLLATSQLPSIPRRLNECARLVCRLFAHDLESTPTPARSSALQPKPIGSREPKPPPAPSRVVEHFEPSTEWEGFRFWEEVERYEAYLIRRALRKTRGVLSRAAALLGVTHQTLESMLKRRHKNLYDLRTPPASRRKSIIRLRETRHNADLSARQAAQVVTILHAEDHALIANMVRDLIESAGWRVVTCTDGADALARLTSQEDYDLLLLDNNLPNVSGVELARCARALPHRRQTPIIMLSATDIEAEAIGAGVDVFLLKPGGAAALFETINQMLNRSDE